MISRGNGKAMEGGQVAYRTRSVGVGLAVSLTPRLQIGLEGRYTPAPFGDEYTVTAKKAPDTRSLSETLNNLASENGTVGISGWQLSSQVSYSLIRPDDLGRLVSRSRAIPYEVRVAVGPTLAMLKSSTKFTTGTISNQFELAYEIHEKVASVEKLHLGAQGQLALDIHVSRAASLGIGVDVQYYPQIQAEAQSVELPTVSSGNKLKFERKPINQSSLLFGFFLSTRVHL